MNRSIEFYLGMSREMKALKCSEMYINVDDMAELITRLRQAEKDASRYRELRDAESETCLEFINAKARAASPEWLDGLVDEYMKCNK